MIDLLLTFKGTEKGEKFKIIIIIIIIIFSSELVRNTKMEGFFVTPVTMVVTKTRSRQIS